MKDEPASHCLEPTGSDNTDVKFRGLTKREYFAIRALQGILANLGPCKYGERAGQAVREADALLKALG